MIMYILLLVVQHLKELTMTYKAPFSQTSIEIQKMLNNTLLLVTSLYYGDFSIRYANTIKPRIYYEI